MNGRSPEGRPFRLEGHEIVFRSRQKHVDAKAGRLTSDLDKLEAQELLLFFGEGQSLNSIQGKGNSRFSNRDVDGGANELNWDWVKSMLYLKESAKITQKGVTTSADELKVDLKSNEIIGRPRPKKLP